MAEYTDTNTDFTTSETGNEDYTTGSYGAEETQGEVDYKSLYEKDKANWEKERTSLGEVAERGKAWDKWYAHYVGPKYKDSRSFHSDLVKWLSTPQGKETQQETYTQAQQQAAHQTQQATQEVIDQAQGELGRNLTRAELNQVLAQRDAYYQNILTQVYNKSMQDTLTHMNTKVLPEYFEVYDRVSDIKGGKLKGNKDEYLKLVNHMIQNNEKDPDKAYAALFGERDSQIERKALEEKIRKELEKKIREEQTNKQLSVLKTNGTFPSTITPNSKTPTNLSMEDIKSQTLQEMVGKYGTNIL